MRSSRRIRVPVLALGLVAAGLCSFRAEAQQRPQGFSLERLYPSAPGGGWFVMDALDMRGRLGGSMELTLGYARNPLRVDSNDGSARLGVVTDQAFADFGFAATYDRLRLYVNFDMPLVIKGRSGTVGGYAFDAPDVDPGSSPDTLSDVRIGFDARLLGGPADRFRLGAGAQLFVPSGTRDHYETDETYRAMGRVLFAGDVGLFTYAGHVGAHVRPLDDSEVPGSPEGSELIAGIAAGAKLPVCGACSEVLVIGPEIYGASAMRSLMGRDTTALEWLLSGRLEGTRDDGPELRVKLGVGAGINPHFGAPEARLVVAVEVFDYNAD